MLRQQNQSIREQLLAEFHDFVIEVGMSETGALVGAGVEKNTLRNIRDGKDCLTGTVDQIRRFMRETREEIAGVQAEAAARAGGA